jgi:hypothetical protein
MSDDDPFWSLRGRAIDAYAGLEQSLCHLLSMFSETKFDVASIIFFKITSAQARDAILEKLVKRKFGNAYSVFWNSVTRLNGQLAQTRNEIVHWTVRELIINNGPPSVGLKPPSIHDVIDPNKPERTAKDLIEFIDKCKFVSSLCVQFWSYLQPNKPPGVLTPEQENAWRDIFQQPATYPPPSSHPLCQKPKEPETPPPPSPG